MYNYRAVWSSVWCSSCLYSQTVYARPLFLSRCVELVGASGEATTQLARHTQRIKGVQGHIIMQAPTTHIGVSKARHTHVLLLVVCAVTCCDVHTTHHFAFFNQCLSESPSVIVNGVSCEIVPSSTDIDLLATSQVSQPSEGLV